MESSRLVRAGTKRSAIGKTFVTSTFYNFNCFVVNEESRDYAVVEFIEEECTAVVPLQHISGSLMPGETVTVLWNNRKGYSAKFLLSGNQKHTFELVINAHLLRLILPV